MTTALCLLALLTTSAPPELPAEQSATEQRVAEAPTPPLKPHEISKALHETLIEEASSKTFAEREEATQKLCGLFYEMMLSKEFPEGERKKWRARLVSRLRSVRDDIERRLPDETERTPRRAVAARGGGAIDQQGANELIDLITTTIDPETWDVHGGTGSIFYYSNLRVLVISQTQEVHEKIGGVAHGLRQGP